MLDSIKKYIKSQVSLVLFSFLLVKEEDRLRLLDSNRPVRTLQTLKLPADVFKEFGKLTFPAHRDEEEMKESNSLPQRDIDDILNTIHVSHNCESRDWFLYGDYVTKVKVLALEEAKKSETIKLKELRGVGLIEKKIEESEPITCNVSIYAGLSRNSVSGDFIEYRPVVNLFAVIETSNNEENNRILSNLENLALLIKVAGPSSESDHVADGSTDLRTLLINAFQEGFLDVVNKQRESVARGIDTIYSGQEFKIVSLVVDSFKRFTADPLASYVNRARTSTDQLELAMLVFNFLFPDYDEFTFADVDAYPPTSLEERNRRVEREVEVSTVIYNTPGTVVTLDDYSDKEVRHHVEDFPGIDAYDEFNFNFGGPRNEIFWNYVYLSRISSQMAIVRYYQRLILNAIKTMSDGKQPRRERIKEVKTLIEIVTDEMSQNTVSMFRHLNIDNDYLELQKINSMNNYRADFESNLNLYGQWVIEEQRFEQAQVQTDIQTSQREILEELKALLNSLKTVSSNTEKLTRRLLILSILSLSISLLSLLIAVLFSLGIL